MTEAELRAALDRQLEATRDIAAAIREASVTIGEAILAASIGAHDVDTWHADQTRADLDWARELVDEQTRPTPRRSTQ